MIQGTLKEVKALDAVLSLNNKPVKDSSGESDCGVYTKTYEVITINPHPMITKFRLWFNEKTDKGSIKVRKIPYAVVTGVSSYTLIQACLLIQQAVTGKLL